MTLSIRTVLGGFTSQFGWLIMGFGMIFVWAFDAGSGLEETVRFAGELSTAQGTATGWRQLNLNINDAPVFETAYVFDVGGGPVQGVSYRTGGYVPEGEPVTVEYRSSDPEISRVQGMRASPAGVGIALVLVIPIIGLVMALFGMRRGLRARHLMATGSLALGTLKSKEQTSTRINDQMVYRLTFEFDAEGGGTYEAVAKTHLSHKLEDEARERLVYDPRYPMYATLLDELPCRPRIDARGDFEAGSASAPLLAALNLVIPTLTLLGHGWYVFLRR